MSVTADMLHARAFSTWGAYAASGSAVAWSHAQSEQQNMQLTVSCSASCQARAHLCRNWPAH